MGFSKWVTVFRHNGWFQLAWHRVAGHSLGDVSADPFNAEVAEAVEAVEAVETNFDACPLTRWEAADSRYVQRRGTWVSLAFDRGGRRGFPDMGRV